MPLRVLKNERIHSFLQRQASPILIVFLGRDIFSKELSKKLKISEQVWVGARVTRDLASKFGILKVPCSIRFKNMIPYPERLVGNDILKGTDGTRSD